MTRVQVVENINTLLNLSGKHLLKNWIYSYLAFLLKQLTPTE